MEAVPVEHSHIRWSQEAEEVARLRVILLQVMPRVRTSELGSTEGVRELAVSLWFEGVRAKR